MIVCRAIQMSKNNYAGGISEEPSVLQADEEDLIVINYHDLCDDIYLMDWC